MGSHGQLALKQYENIRNSNVSPEAKEFLYGDAYETLSCIRGTEAAGRSNIKTLRVQGEKTAIRIIVAIPFACAILGFIGSRILK